MSALTATLRALIRDELRALRLGDIAVVTSVFPHKEGDAHNYELSVRLRESELELRQVPMCTPHLGMASVPAVGELVLVTYVGGDGQRPVIVGRLYSDEHAPPEHAEKEWVVQSPLGAETSIRLDKEGAIVCTAGGTTLTLKKDGDVLIKGGGAVNIEVDGAVSLKCSDAKVDASGNVEIKGAQVKLN